MNVLRILSVVSALCIAITAGEARALSSGRSDVPILSTEPLTHPQAVEGLSATLGDTVWMDDSRAIWFQRVGDRFHLRVVDASGFVDQSNALAPIVEKGLLKSGEAEASRRLSENQRIHSAYEWLPSNDLEILDLRTGSILQERNGRFVTLYYAAVQDDGQLVVTLTPAAQTIGRFFPDRPSIWTRITRRVASWLPWTRVPLLDYHRAPSPVEHPYDMVEGSPWPIDLILQEGGERGWRFFNKVGQAGWSLERGKVFRRTTLAAPRGAKDDAAIQRIRNALEPAPTY